MRAYCSFLPSSAPAPRDRLNGWFFVYSTVCTTYCILTALVHCIQYSTVRTVQDTVGKFSGAIRIHRSPGRGGNYENIVCDSVCKGGYSKDVIERILQESSIYAARFVGLVIVAGSSHGLQQ